MDNDMGNQSKCSVSLWVDKDKLKEVIILIQ